jgi:hypothetical protein
VTIVNYASSGVSELKASLNDDARVVIYNRHIFIVQATGSLNDNFTISLSRHLAVKTITNIKILVITLKN